MSKTESTCLIIDDDDFARETLKDLLSTFDNITVIKLLKDSRTAIKDIALLKPDLVFLDINMPQKNGLKIIDEINELKVSTRVVFVTAHSEFVMEALKKNAFDYLMKPVNKAELTETLQRFFTTDESLEISPPAKSDQTENNKIIIKNSRGTLYYHYEDILYTLADGCYTYIYSPGHNPEVITKNIGSIEGLFPATHFFRISRSAIVNIDYIAKIDHVHRQVHLFSGKENIKIKGSKNRLYDLEHLINNHRSN